MFIEKCVSMRKSATPAGVECFVHLDISINM
jgi:hypothetical protein